MFAKSRAQKRHTRLMDVAGTLINEAAICGDTKKVAPAHVVALAFGQLQLRIEESEAAEYLAAALVMRGHSIDHLPAVLAA
ncbi:hypothetical protein [Streptomyces sp. NPDC050738]|uniref:hypothetical protein n=1 Tax=Streptomyces sp. NPDC050738 TaxID=3154744 RepID=UPI0034385915